MQVIDTDRRQPATEGSEAAVATQDTTQGCSRQQWFSYNYAPAKRFLFAALPAEVGNKQAGMQDEADGVIDQLGVAEGLVPTLVSNHPDTCGSHTQNLEPLLPVRIYQ